MLRKTSLVLRNEIPQGNVISGVCGSCSIIQSKPLWQLMSASPSLKNLVHDPTIPWGEIKDHRESVYIESNRMILKAAKRCVGHNLSFSQSWKDCRSSLETCLKTKADRTLYFECSLKGFCSVMVLVEITRSCSSDLRTTHDP
jgi:hypothetical protein